MSRICMRKTTFFTSVYPRFTLFSHVIPVHARFNPGSIFTQVYSRFSRLPMSTLVYPYFTPFTLVYARLSAFHPVFRQVYASLSTLNSFTHVLPFYPRLFTFIPFTHILPRYYPCLSRVIHASSNSRSVFTPVSTSFNLFTLSVLTPVYPRFSPFTMFTNFYPCFFPFLDVYNRYLALRFVTSRLIYLRI